MMQQEDSQQHSLKVRLLGTGEFHLGETLRFSYTKVQALLLLLLLEKVPLSRERLTYLLWPNQDATQARSNLRNALHLLRKVVGKSRVGGNLQFVTWHQQGGDWLDVDELCQAPSAQQLDLLSTYSGEILSNFVVPDAPSFMDWLDTKRMHYQGAVMACTDKLYEQAVSQQRIDMRVAVAKIQVRIDPWNEELQQRLITSLAHSGDTHGALAQWDQACSLFQRELDIQLSPDSQSLLREIQKKKSREPLNVINASGGGSPSIEELAATPMQSAALLHIDCYAKDPHNTEAIHSLQLLRMAIERCVLANDGLMAWRNGGSCLIRFDTQTGRSSNCERAMQTAIEVNQTIHQMDEQSKHFSVGLGLTRGLLLPANGDQLDPLGHFAHVASLLACSAHDGKILSTRLFALRLPQQPWVTWPRKWESGTHEPLSIVRWGGKAASPLPEGPLLGRSSQQQFLQMRWAQVIQGTSKAVLLSGSPGSGKSRLTRWAIQHLNPSANCWFMDCQPARHDSPGAPLADWLARTCGMSANHTLQERGNLFKQWLHKADISLSTHCTDTLCRLLGLLPDDVTFTPTRRRRDMLDAFVELLTIETQQTPLLLVVEDMHWADATTVSVLDAALTQLAQHPLMIVGTTRPTEHLPNNWSKLDITPLNARQSLALIQHILSTSEASHAPAPVNTLKEMAERSGGNPLFIESLAYALVHTPGEFPMNLEEGLLSPIARDKDATQLAQAASVLGEEFDLNLTRSLCHALPEGSFHAALQRMLRHGLMHQQAGVLRFRHALIRDAVYACLTVANKQSLHQQVIEACLNNSPELAVQQPLWLARHAEQAGMTLQAIEWYEMAAMQALSVASFAEAIAHFNKALALLQTAPANPSTAHQALRLALGCANATVPLCGYGAQATRDAFLAVLNLGHAQPDSNEVFLAHYGLWLGASSQGGYRQALQYVERLQAHADRSGDPVHHMQTEYAWGNTYMWLGELAHAEVHLRRALESCSGDAAQGLLASYSEDTGVIAGSLLAWVRWLQGNDAEALALRAQALARAQALSHPYSMAFALACAARLDILRGDTSAIEQHVNQLDLLANKHDLGLWLALAAVQKGWLRCAQGHADGALLAAQGVELAAPALPALEVTMLSMQADALHRLGDGPGCLRVVQHALARCEHWDDRYMQPELLRLAACHASSEEFGREWLSLAKTQALNQGAKSWVQQLGC